VGDRPTLVVWFTVAAVCLSPILTFWTASVFARFLRRKRWQRAQRDASDGVDRTARLTTRALAGT
jgi:hypothetical protein